MASIRACKLPEDALLRRYSEPGAYTDCYVTELAWHVRHAEYVQAFYTTLVFRLERLLLAWLVDRPSTDAEARELASGTSRSFAAWTVEAREPNQLLLCDFQGRTRSWLMSAQPPSARSTMLFFGSAVVPHVGSSFKALLGFHKVYSRVLLGAAAARLARSARVSAQEPLI